MTIATAVLLTVLCAGTDQAPTPTAAPALSSAPEAQKGTAGIIIAADIEGRVAIYQGEHQLVVKVDKPAGQPVQIALEPGAYEARLGERGSRRTRFQLAAGQHLVIDLASFPADAAPAPEAGDVSGEPVPPSPARVLDPRHRIEVRFGGWADGWDDGWYGYDDDWDPSGSAQGAFGFEYLNFIRNDLGIGIALSTLANAQGDWDDWDHGGAAQVITSVPVVVRWYPARRMTASRAVEPYVTAGIGPVFGVDTMYIDGRVPHHWDDHGDGVTSTRVATTIGGRLGGGVDFRLGSVFTLGVGAAWNWHAGFPDDLWRGAEPSGGEFTVAMGWIFGR